MISSVQFFFSSVKLHRRNVGGPDRGRGKNESFTVQLRKRIEEMQVVAEKETEQWPRMQADKHLFRDNKTFHVDNGVGGIKHKRFLEINLEVSGDFLRETKTLLLES